MLTFKELIPNRTTKVGTKLAPRSLKYENLKKRLYVGNYVKP